MSITESTVSFREQKEDPRPSREDDGSARESSEHSREASQARSCECECHGHGHRPCNLETAPSRMDMGPLQDTFPDRPSRPSPFPAKKRTTQDVPVDSDGPGDPYRLMNSPTHKKVSSTLLYGLSPGLPPGPPRPMLPARSKIVGEFNVGRQVATPGTALFLLGFGPFVLLTTVLFIDETYPPKLLVAKTSRLRHWSGSWVLRSRFEELDVSVAELTRKFLIRPLGAMPIFLHGLRGWAFLTSEFPFLALCLGSITGTAVIVANQLYYNRAYLAARDRPVPEKRLPPMNLGFVRFTAGEFVTGWTADPCVAHWIAAVLSLYLSGCGDSTIFQAALNYLVDNF
ncbi:hypothetical protein DL766_007985 [Monosporascus sp. MC13-8B]|uniref:Uncharacterized protein n=1 Tax=Monosporascus cannonballus TaxID=155416 RepID=A0ABY0H206_9PEZI|nr:hypothetical protein DL762_006437 [Monosporascus cannonballus]RYO86004.1 hypothetical protein DL763_006874 [Monosporascus cannonballus]RYP21300.1 hypothetical protein DL766_007985 [Monosporascus sp. MC13-8B]